MNENSETPPELIEETNGHELATRWQRFLASMLDGVIIMAIIAPAMILTGGFDDVSSGGQPSLGYSMLMAAIGMAGFVLLNGKLLATSGQTIGKKALGIKIVDTNGNLPSVKQHLLKRYAVYFLPGQIPIAGGLFSTINILFIFGKQKRCIHDNIGDTMVVKSQC